MGYVKFSQAGQKIIWPRSTANNAIDLKIINEKNAIVPATVARLTDKN